MVKQGVRLRGTLAFAHHGRDNNQAVIAVILRTQVDLFAAPPVAAQPAEPSAVDAALAAIDPDALSPREALEALYRLKRLSG